jgi:hypothetical protein
MGNSLLTSPVFWLVKGLASLGSPVRLRKDLNPGYGSTDLPVMRSAAMVTDAEIQQIVEDNEAGVTDVLEAYEFAESSYMAAAAWTPHGEVIVVSSNTSAV